MKPLFFTLTLLLLSSTQVFSQTSDLSIDVIIDNIKSDQGTIKIGLYKSEETFLRNPIKSISEKAKKEGIKVTFENLEEGEYAISLYHDEDDNQKLNTFFKIPTEPYGTSNNAKGKFGPPKWEDAKFKVSDTKETQHITL
ncbi:DUF2141 domain-containing protein [Aquimarina mytili]|uniref:DUF2141 domain-containing protein n=1 Tax=Aquimarina mytili TaxID=874423 RepID=A0A937D6G5_9FLAO|nr:DUF2141 domain-containing protein [Aquimarina mytili]MBL0684384.1 DUF2141 domain-containing protein [Aquimarina mytili]